MTDLDSLGCGTFPRKGWRLSRAASRSGGSAAGVTLVELLIVIFVMAVLAAASIPSMTSYLHERRLRGAAVYVRSLMRQARARAASENRYVGIVFDEVEGEPVMSVYGDGNGNGIRRADIRVGIEERLGEPYRLTDSFPGVHYGNEPDAASPNAPVFPGLRIGKSKIVSFSPIGSCTPGTLFLSNDYDLVYAVVLFGTTGRVRLARHLGGRWHAI